MAKNKIKIQAYLPENLHAKVQGESDATGVSVSALVALALAVRYEGELVSPNHVNRILEDARLKDEENG